MNRAALTFPALVFALAASAAVAQAPRPAALAPARPVAQSPVRSPAQSNAQPITRASFIATMDAEYRKLDANNDGVATRVEIEANQQRILATGAATRAQALFVRIDTDRNGQLSPAEFIRASVGQPQKVDVTTVMGRLDPNRDGKVTLIEYRTLTLTNFDRLDVDKDGIASVTEQRAGGIVK